ncbi:hypothetical protein [Mycobacterium sp. CnD-18-1]|nr:hypothetical protein [Mycobacterium sp. CnD-18-1]
MNPIYAAERAEYRAALASMSEMDRAATEHDRPDIYGWNPEDNL